MKKIANSVSISLLNFPESILDGILERLSPIELIKMSEVCICLRNKCRSDHFWEIHMKQKWGRVIGHVALKEWQWHVTSITAEEGSVLNQQINNIQNGSLGSFSGAWPMLCLGSYFEECTHLKSLLLSNNFKMALYLSLESGKFWFPAQLFRVKTSSLSYSSELIVCSLRINYHISLYKSIKLFSGVISKFLKRVFFFFLSGTICSRGLA